MNFPNKIITYRESVIPKMIDILEVISEDPQTVHSVYMKLSEKFTSIVEYMYALDCLYALGKIDVDNEENLIRYVD